MAGDEASLAQVDSCIRHANESWAPSGNESVWFFWVPEAGQPDVMADLLCKHTSML